MIICPSCKEEIEEVSHYCDQCGQKLVYCTNCGRVGMGRRCTYCGGLMASPDELKQQREKLNHRPVVSNSVHSLAGAHVGASVNVTYQRKNPEGSQMPVRSGIPTLTLFNPTLDIRMVGINGAIIGRRQGPYQKLFVDNMYVSGAHAQLIYKPDNGWCIIDKHSSNGTKLNQRDLMPDVPMSIKSGDIVTLANINLQVSIN